MHAFGEERRAFERRRLEAGSQAVRQCVGRRREAALLDGFIARAQVDDGVAFAQCLSHVSAPYAGRERAPTLREYR